MHPELNGLEPGELGSLFCSFSLVCSPGSQIEFCKILAKLGLGLVQAPHSLEKRHDEIDPNDNKTSLNLLFHGHAHLVGQIKNALMTMKTFHSKDYEKGRRKTCAKCHPGCSWDPLGERVLRGVLKPLGRPDSGFAQVHCG